MDQLLGAWTGQLGISGGKGTILFLAVIVWTLVWKGLALWRAAREEHKWWFVVLMIMNTLGILEILYLFFFSDRARAARGADAARKGDGADAVQ